MRLGNGPGFGTVGATSMSRLLFPIIGPMRSIPESSGGLWLVRPLLWCSFGLSLLLLLSMYCSWSASPQHRQRKALVMENGILGRVRGNLRESKLFLISQTLNSSQGSALIRLDSSEASYREIYDISMIFS